MSAEVLRMPPRGKPRFGLEVRGHRLPILGEAIAVSNSSGNSELHLADRAGLTPEEILRRLAASMSLTAFVTVSDLGDGQKPCIVSTAAIVTVEVVQ